MYTNLNYQTSPFSTNNQHLQQPNTNDFYYKRRQQPNTNDLDFKRRQQPNTNDLDFKRRQQPNTDDLHFKRRQQPNTNDLDFKPNQHQRWQQPNTDFKPNQHQRWQQPNTNDLDFKPNQQKHRQQLQQQDLNQTDNTIPTPTSNALNQTNDNTTPTPTLNALNQTDDKTTSNYLNQTDNTTSNYLNQTDDNTTPNYLNQIDTPDTPIMSRMGMEEKPIGVAMFLNLDFPRPTIDIHKAVVKAMGLLWAGTDFGIQLENCVRDHLTKTKDAIEEKKKYNLSDDEAGAIAYYTADVREPSRERNPYHALNKCLKDRNVTEQYQAFLFYLMSGLKKLPNVRSECYRYVDIPLTILSTQYRERNTVVWVAFTSTSADNKKMKEFQENSKGESPTKEGTIMVLECKGKDLSKISLFPSEAEILLMPNSEFEVISVLSKEMKTVMCHPKRLDVIHLRQKKRSKIIPPMSDPIQVPIPKKPKVKPTSKDLIFINNLVQRNPMDRKPITLNQETRKEFTKMEQYSTIGMKAKLIKHLPDGCRICTCQLASCCDPEIFCDYCEYIESHLKTVGQPNQWCTPVTSDLIDNSNRSLCRKGPNCIFKAQGKCIYRHDY